MRARLATRLFLSLALWSLALAQGCTHSAPVTCATDGDCLRYSRSERLVVCDVAAHLCGQPRARITATPDLVGFPTALDGSLSIPPNERAVAFAWRVTRVPAGSAITDASLTVVPSSGTTHATFEPDRGGDYTVELTATLASLGSDVATATVSVPTLPLLYDQGVVTPATQVVGVGLVRSDGSGAHLVDCASTLSSDPDGGFRSDDPILQSSFLGLRTWEPPPGAAARFAFLELRTLAADGGPATEYRLFSADENTDCTSQPPRRIDEAANPLFASKRHYWPRFSPDGARVLFVDDPEAAGAARIVTVGADGKDLRVIRSAVQLHGAPPVWADATHVDWAEDVTDGATGVTYPAVFGAEDKSFDGDANRQEKLHCFDGVKARLAFINQFELGGGGLVVAGGATRLGATPPGSVNLYRMVGKSCVPVNVIAQEPSSGVSWDFTLSPDTVTIAMASTHGQTPIGGARPQQDIFLVPADGSSPPRRFAGDPLLDDVGPRWVAGGRQLIWTQEGVGADGLLHGGGLMIANADGTHVRSLLPVASSPQATTYVVAGSNLGLACSWAGTTRAPLALLFAAAAALLVFATRRRRQ